ncbi:DNA/RNA non-specific endonuclease, partial [Paenarthrobacter aurescens]
KDVTAEETQAVLTTLNAAKETIHYDEWGTDPAYALGATTFDVATLFAGGAGVGIKAGSTAGRLGLAAQRLSTATMGSPRLGVLSSPLSNAANGLHRTGLLLDKPGSLALKLSDLVMPSTTARVLDTITQSKAATWAALENAKRGVTHLVSGGKHVTADVMNSLAQGLRNVDTDFPTAFHPEPSGLLARTADNSAVPNWLDKSAADIRENAPHARGGSGALVNDASRAPHAPVVPDPFPPQNNITNTVVLQHGHDLFPVSRKDNFAAKTGLEPNTLYIVDNRTKMPDNTGGLTADSLERFYTDATGRVERVDTYAGVRGAWSVELNKRMPNVTYNVVAKTDGGLENHFTIITDDFAKPKSVEAHITGLLKGDINRSAWQQILAGIRVGGRGYEGGHLIASLFAGPGEGANLLAQLMFQNRGHGTPNVSANTLAFYQLEREVMTKALHRVDTGQPLDLHLKIEAVPGPKPGLPESLKVTHSFDGGLPRTNQFSNMPIGEQEMQ